MADIPRIIHYCWFGGSPLGPNELSCIESWKKYLPGYEIKCWNESNFDINCCAYVREAFSAQKWAFVSDYARFKILYEYGGLYFDTDVELVKSIDDLLSKGPFLGFETDYGNMTSSNMEDGLVMAVNPGLGMGCTPGLPIYRQVLDSYESSSFLLADGDFDRTTVVYRTTKILESFGLNKTKGMQEVAGISIYPSEYFNPKNHLTGEVNFTDNTRSIHHFKMSWFTPQEKFQHSVNRWLLMHGVDETPAKIISVALSLDIKRVIRRLKKKK